MWHTGRDRGPKETMGSAIKGARQYRGWTLGQAAQYIKINDKPISKQYLHDIENNKRFPASDDLLDQLAKVYEIDLDWLYYLCGKFPKIDWYHQYSEAEFKRRMKCFRKELN